MTDQEAKLLIAGTILSIIVAPLITSLIKTDPVMRGMITSLAVVSGLAFTAILTLILV